MTAEIKTGLPVCPVACKYCMASKLHLRADYWKQCKRMGLNKSSIFINRAPNDPSLQEMDFPWDLFQWDYLGYQGTSDCFWSIFKDDLRYLVEMVLKWNIRRLCLISKIPITDEQIEILNPLKDGRRVALCYSITGMDALEKTTTKSRIEALVRIREAGFKDYLPVIHPYIHGYTPIEEIFQELRDNGFKEFSFKGFRYDPEGMESLRGYIPESVLQQYEKGGQEVLLGEEEVRKLASEMGLREIGVKDFYHRNPMPRTTSSLIVEEKEKLMGIINHPYTVISSSASTDDVLNYCASRRL